VKCVHANVTIPTTPEAVEWTLVAGLRISEITGVTGPFSAEGAKLSSTIVRNLPRSHACRVARAIDSAARGSCRGRAWRGCSCRS
jgi:hypothetical protein